MERLRGDHRYGITGDGGDFESQSFRLSRPPSRFSDAPPPLNHGFSSRQSPSGFHGGPNRPFESSPRRSPAESGSGGFGPVSGQKRGFPRGGSPDRFERGGSAAKLFVGSVPRTANEEDVRPIFEEHGNVLEVALIKDKKTGLRQGCCFIKYGTSEEADQAIRALHNQRTLPGGVGPIQVRYADGERERLGAVEYKLFVGSMNKEATEKDIGEIFSEYGQVEDVYLMRDDMKQSRGCGFVKFSHREMALAAINALNGTFTMRGCDQPLTVRFADPKRPRLGDSRGGPSFGGPGFGLRFQGPGARSGPNFSDPVNDRMPPSAWQAMSPPNMGLSTNANNPGFAGPIHPRPGDLAPSGNMGGRGSSAENSLSAVTSSSMSQPGFNQPVPSLAPLGPKISPLQKPNQSPQQMPPQQSTASYSQPQQTPFASLPQPHRPYSQTPFNGPPSGSQPQAQSARTTNIQAQSAAPMASNPNQQLPAQQPPVQHRQSPSHLAQMLSQQKQSLQASFQSSQQAFSQLQQQMISMQPPNHGPQDYKQNQWAGNGQQSATSVPSAAAMVDMPSSSATMAVGKCIWTEHTSPDGYKYYYNSASGESKWEKPEELRLYELQQQKATAMQSHSQIPTSQQMQFQPPYQMQYQAPGFTGHQNHPQGYVQAQGPNGLGHQASQEWMWKNNMQAGSRGA